MQGNGIDRKVIKWNGRECNELNGMECNRMEWNGEMKRELIFSHCYPASVTERELIERMEYNRTVWNSMQWNGTEWNGMKCNAIEWNGV